MVHARGLNTGCTLGPSEAQVGFQTPVLNANSTEAISTSRASDPLGRGLFLNTCVDIQHYDFQFCVDMEALITTPSLGFLPCTYSEYLPLWDINSRQLDGATCCRGGGGDHQGHLFSAIHFGAQWPCDRLFSIQDLQGIFYHHSPTTRILPSQGICVIIYSEL